MRARAVVVIAALVLVGSGCSNSPSKKADTSSGSSSVTTAAPNQDSVHLPVTAPGVTDSEIHVGSVTSTTNPLGGNYGDLNKGIKAYFSMLNGSGGLYGRQLKLTSERDDAVGNNQAQVQAMISQDDVFAVFGATLIFSGADLLDQERVPTFQWNINPEITGKTGIFADRGALCFGCAEPELPWVAKQVKATKVGVLAYGVSEESKKCAEGIKASFEKYPSATVAFFDDSLPFGVPDLSAQVSDMKSAGVDFVTTCMDFNGVFTLAKEMDKQQLKAPQYLPNGYNPEFMAANGSFFEGSYVATGFTAFEQKPLPQGVTDFLTWMGKANEKPTELAMVGWILADELVTGLRKAGPQFSRQAVIDALNAGIYDPGGIIAPIDWRYEHKDPTVAGNASPIGCVTVVQVKSSAFVPVLASNGPWSCFDHHQPTLPDKPLTLDEARAVQAKGPI